MRKILSIAAIVVIAGALGFQAYRLNVQRLDLEAHATGVESEINSLAAEQQQINADLDYYADVSNLGKATRALDNFRAPGETLFILVPSTQPTP